MWRQSRFIFKILKIKESMKDFQNNYSSTTLSMSNLKISTHLPDIFNLSFSSGIFPSILKIAKVIPVHKKESKLFCSNYRPISLLSNIDKIIEKIMYNRIYKFLDKNNIIYSLQFGFRHYYTALLYFIYSVKSD